MFLQNTDSPRIKAQFFYVRNLYIVSYDYLTEKKHFLEEAV